MDIKVKSKEGAGKAKPDDSKLGFGKYTTDHMFCMKFNTQSGWHNARIEPYGDLRLDPAAMVLHYGQEVFEGLKAYRLAGGGIGLFRPDRNIARMNASAERMVMPRIDLEFMLQAMKELILLDQDWIPHAEGTSLYIRPTMIASEAALGVRPATEYLFYIIIGPVGPYYPEGFNPTRIYVSDQYVRAVKGGAGEAKTACNYGPTLFVQQQAAQKGYTQVLWLDAKENRFAEEVGTSNIFFHFENELVTPPLGGSILTGITRDSVIHLARHWGINVIERPVAINEITAGCRNGSLKEMYATGTAAVISPVGEIGYQDANFKIGNGRVGELAKKFYDEITGIQYGRKEDRFGWVTRLS